MLSEHSSDRLRFLIRKGGKNADLIGKESLWIYTVYHGVAKKEEKMITHMNMYKHVQTHTRKYSDTYVVIL